MPIAENTPLVQKGTLAKVLRPCEVLEGFYLVEIKKPAAGSYYKAGDIQIWEDTNFL